MAAEDDVRVGVESVPHDANVALTGVADNSDASKTFTEGSSGISGVSGESGQPGAAEQPPAEEQQDHKMSKTKTSMIMMSLALATFLAALDVTIVTTALPTIVQRFNASEADYTWIGSAYLLASASSSPSWGKISDIFGRKPVLLIANLIFMLGSLLCGVSRSSRMLIGSRAVQGLGGGGLLSMVNICIGDLFSMRMRSVFYAVIGVVWAIAGAFGPILGGVFTQSATWRWCFYVDLPADGIALVAIILFLKIDTPKTPILEGLRAIDWLGTATCAGGTVMFLLGLNYGGESHPWDSAIVICLIVFGVVCWGVFGFIQAKVSRYPISPPWLFTSRGTLAPYLVCFIHGFCYTGLTYFLPLYFQAVLGATPILSGVYLFPIVVSVAIGSLAVGAIIGKTGHFRPPLWVGMALMLLGLGLFIDFPAKANWAKLILYQGIAGLGSGPNFQAPLIALQSQINPSDIATATSTFGFIRNMGSAVSVVIGGVIFQNVMHQKLPRLRGKIPDSVYERVYNSSAGAAATYVKALPKSQRTKVQGVYTESLQMVWVFFTCLAAVGFLVSFLIKKKTLTRTHQVTKTGLEAQEEARELRLQEKRDKKAKKLEGKGNEDLEKAA